MKTTIKNKKLEDISKDSRFELFEFLSDESTYQRILNILEKQDLMLENEIYQLHISSIEEIKQIKTELEEMFSEVNCY